MEFLGEPCCALCQRPFEVALEKEALCAPCMEESPKHDGLAAATLYGETSRTLILGLKRGHRIALARTMAQIMAGRLAALDLPIDGSWMLVPVPLHWRRLWERGFNQSVLIGRELQRLGYGHMCVDGLRRRKYTPHLSGLTQKVRQQTLRGVITISDQEATLFQGRNIVLVDDVYTTGATSAACVKALKKAGAKRVVIACFSRRL